MWWVWLRGTHLSTNQYLTTIGCQISNINYSCFERIIIMCAKVAKFKFSVLASSDDPLYECNMLYFHKYISSKDIYPSIIDFIIRKYKLNKENHGWSYAEVCIVHLSLVDPWCIASISGGRNSVVLQTGMHILTISNFTILG